MLKYLEKNKVWFVYTPLIIYWIALFVGTSLPTQYVPGLGVKDKVEHFLAYMILVILLSFTFLFQRRIKILWQKPILSAFLLSCFYGALDELHQLLVPGRSCELLDFIADTIGVILGVIISFAIIKLDYLNRIKTQEE